MLYGRERPENYDFEFDRQIIKRCGSGVPGKVFAAGDVCELTEAQWENIFYNNAAKLYFTPIRK